MCVTTKAREWREKMIETVQSDVEARLFLKINDDYFTILGRYTSIQGFQMNVVRVRITQ